MLCVSICWVCQYAECGYARLKYNAEYHYVKCCYVKLCCISQFRHHVLYCAECLHVEYHYAQCHYGMCQNAECGYAKFLCNALCHCVNCCYVKCCCACYEVRNIFDVTLEIKYSILIILPYFLPSFNIAALFYCCQLSNIDILAPCRGKYYKQFEKSVMLYATIKLLCFVQWWVSKYWLSKCQGS